MSSRPPPPLRPVRRPRVLGAGLVLLALWMQVLTPAAALRAASAALDPLRDAVICGAGPGAHGPATVAAEPAAEPPAPALPPCGPCRFCCTGVAAPALPAVVSPAGSLRWGAVSWPTPPPDGPGRAVRPAGQPRAPPSPA